MLGRSSRRRPRRRPTTMPSVGVPDPARGRRGVRRPDAADTGADPADRPGVEETAMQARDIMTRPVITFRATTSTREAAAVLTSKQITAAPVVDETDEIIGIVSEGDLIADRFEHDPRSRARRDIAPEHETPATVGEVMTDTVIALSATADAADLAET